MEKPVVSVWHSVVSLKHDLLNIAVKLQNENEATCSREELAQSVIDAVHSCSDLEGILLNTSNE